MARAVVLAFGQSVCGFDLLRSPAGSVICDVNGWSFVKSSSAYYLDAAEVAAAATRARSSPFAAPARARSPRLARLCGRT